MSEVNEKPAPFWLGPEVATAKVFTHGGSQAVRLPKAFRFEGAEVSIRKEGEAVILEPLKPHRPRSAEDWAAFWKSIDDLGPSTLEVPRDESPWRDVPEW